MLGARIAAGVDPHEVVDHNGSTPIFVAAAYNRSDMARMLIAERGDVNRASQSAS